MVRRSFWGPTVMLDMLAHSTWGKEQADPAQSLGRAVTLSRQWGQGYVELTCFPQGIGFQFIPGKQRPGKQATFIPAQP